MGDTLHVSVGIDVAEARPLGGFVFEYRLDEDVRLVPGSLIADGAVVVETDENSQRLDVVTVSIVATSQDYYQVSFDLRVVGGIGGRIEHAATLEIDGTLTDHVFAPPSWIEDETASLHHAKVNQDNFISKVQPNSNFGGSSSLEIANALAGERRALIEFDIASVRSEIDELRAAHAEFWMRTRPASTTPLFLHEVRTAWVEGAQNGTACLLGLASTWNSPNCLLGWDPGGDFDAAISGSAFAASSAPWISIDARALTQRWVDGSSANLGAIVLINGGANAAMLAFDSADGGSDPLRSPRLALLQAPRGAYDLRALDNARAEIVPTLVSTSVRDQRFTYSFRLTGKPEHTGVNRLRIEIPEGFTVTSIDSVLVDGDSWPAFAPGDDTPSFEVWSMDERIDLRFSSTVSASPEVIAHVIFRADTPVIESSTGLPFPSLVDHDRRGYPAQSATKGDANGGSGGNDTDSWSVRVLDIVRAVYVTPADTSIALGQSIDYQAIAEFGDSRRVDVSELAEWTITPDSIGSFEDTSRLLASAEGEGVVHARFEGVLSEAAKLEVESPVLVAVDVRPAEVSVAAGDTAHFDAIGRFSDGSELDLGSEAAWSVDDTTIATLVAAGKVRGRHPGSTGVLATAPSVESGQALLDVGPPALKSLAITPVDTTVALGFGVTFRAKGSMSDGTIVDLSSVVTWSASPAGVVDIGDDGIASTIGTGVTLVRAELDDVESPVTSVTVTSPVLVALDGTPDQIEVPVGLVRSFTSRGTYSDGSTADKTGAVTWTSLDPAIADFVAAGQVETRAVGTARLRHALGEVEGDTLVVIVTPVTISAIVIAPRPLTLAPEVQLALSATALLTDDSELDVTTSVDWSSTVPDVAAVDSTGLLRTIGAGNTQIFATLNSVVSEPCDVEVDPDALDALVVAPADTSLARGASLRYTALGYFDGDVFDLSESVKWVVADTTIAHFGSTATVLAVSEGTTTVMASLGSVNSAAADLQVLAPRVLSVEVRPSSASILIGRTRAFVANAVRTDGTVIDVTESASWISSMPGVVHLEPWGTAHGITVGEAWVHATFDGVASETVRITVLPAVTVQSLPLGIVRAWPGDTDQALLYLRLTNHYINARTLETLRVGGLDATPGPPLDGSTALDRVRLFLDDGDGVLDPQSDTMLREGVLASGSWTATDLGLTLPVGASRRVFVTGDVSLVHASFGDSLDLEVAGATDLIWSESTAMVGDPPFPLRSPGYVEVEGLVLAQLGFFDAGADTTAPGSVEVEVLRVTLPADGRRADVLDAVRLDQLGSALAGADLASLRVQQRSGITSADGQAGKVPGSTSVQNDWVDVTTLVPTGGSRWSASQIGLAVPLAGATIRVVADVAATAQVGRSIRMRVPLNAFEFESGRIGPLDGSWASSNSVVVDVIPTLRVLARTIPAPGVIARGDVRVPVLGLTLITSGAPVDTLETLRLRHTSSGPTGAGADPHSQIEAVELWHDVDADGSLSDLDILLASPATPDASGMIDFALAAGPPLVLPVAQSIPLLVTLTPDATRVRDAEQLSLHLESKADLTTFGKLQVELDPTDGIATQNPPVVDGQDADGYELRAVEGGLLTGSTSRVVVLDLRLPANGYEADQLTALTIHNAGTATHEDVASLTLVRDDGSGVLDDGDIVVGTFEATGDRTWSMVTSGLALDPDVDLRCFVVLEGGAEPTPGSTFVARVPIGGIVVNSANDGPRDRDLFGGEPFVFTGSDVVTWLAGAAGSTTIVAPTAMRQPVLVLEAYNGTEETRTLESLRVHSLGTALDREFGAWTLYADHDQDGLIGPGDTALRTAFVVSGVVDFGGFSFDLPPAQQRRLIVTFSLDENEARDASTVDAVVADASSFGFAAENGATSSIGAFPLDSIGVATVDGFVLEQLASTPVPSRSLPGGESRVLTLDLWVPSNGWSDDVLRSLTVELAAFGPETTARLGDDVEVLELWVETDSDPASASFDPFEDLRIGSFDALSLPIQFSGLSMNVPRGGRRVYVTVNIHPSATDGRQVQLRVPVDGIEMDSDNDGPRDAAFEAGVVHRISDRVLLASVSTGTSLVSQGQIIEVDVDVRNTGLVGLDGVQLVTLDADPPTAATQIAGPAPAMLDVGAGEELAFTTTWRMDQVGPVRFVATAGLPDSVVSDPATSLPVLVESPPSALALDPVSNAPVSVNRGQRGVTPLLWQLSHPGPDSSAAAIRVQRLRFSVEDAQGQPQPAASVIDRLEVRTGGLVHAFWDEIPDSTALTILLASPIELSVGEQRVLPLEVGIASDATASTFRLHLQALDAAAAVDVNSGLSVPLLAPEFWTTSAAAIRTLASHADVSLDPVLPVAVNRGQSNVPLLSLRIELPGAPGASEARMTELRFALLDADSMAIDPSTLSSALRVVSESAVLYESSTFSFDGEQTTLVFTIPKVVVSGAPVRVDVHADIAMGTTVPSFSVVLTDSTDITVRDTNTGTVVPAVASQELPYVQGPAQVQDPAPAVQVDAVVLLPTSIGAGAVQVPVVRLALEHPGAAGGAAIEVTGLVARVLDEAAVPRIAAQELDRARVRVAGSGGAVLGTASSFSASEASFEIVFDDPLRVEAGAMIGLELEVDLDPESPALWLRFALDGNALSLRDANDTSRSPGSTGDLPVVSSTMAVVRPPSAAALGTIVDPPANAALGTTVRVLTLRLEHPGVAGEAMITPEALVLCVRGIQDQPLVAAELFSQARLHRADWSVDAMIAGDSLHFQLAGLAAFEPGAAVDLELEATISSVPPVRDLVLEYDAAGYVARSGSVLPVVAVSGSSVPYRSPSLHLVEPDLRSSLSNYPNPFAAGRETTQVTFVLAGPSVVTVEVYTVTGDRVVRLLDRVPLAAGLHDGESLAALRWDGRNGEGNVVRNGAYLLRVLVDGPGGGEVLHKMGVLR